MTPLITKLSSDTMIQASALEYLIRSAPYRYKVFEVEKKGGMGKRTIAQPAREVKALQYWVIDNVLRDFPIHPAAMAYRKGSSIRDNASLHAQQRFLLKLDFADFFHSITAQDFEAYLAASSPNKWTREEVVQLERILFWNRNRAGRLIMSIGAPSSPALSNALMFEFDERVQAICRGMTVNYSRYADDLTFSTNFPNILRDVDAHVEGICRDLKHPRLVLRREKTVHASRAGSRRVTGLVLSNAGTVSLGRERKRLIRAEVHHFLSGNMEPEDAIRLRGMLAFVNAAEPTFLDRLRDAYGTDAISRIMSLGS